MVKVVPFKAIRAVPGYAPFFSSESYENIQQIKNPEQEKVISYKNILHPSGEGVVSGNDDFRESERILKNLFKEGHLVREDDAVLYVYRQIKDGRSFTGIIAAVSVDDYCNNLVRKHELTRTHKEDEIARYFTELKINGSPILLTYPEKDNVELLIKSVLNNEPLYDFSDHGIQHQLWVVNNNDYIETLQGEFSRINCLYIADGHHRCAAYARAWEKLDVSNGKGYLMAFLISDNGLKVCSYNRLLLSLNGMQPSEFINSLRMNFQVTEMPDNEFNPQCEGEVGLYIDGKWIKLEIPSYLKTSGSVKESLDVQILEDYILKGILQIHNSRTSDKIMFAEGSAGTRILQQKVDSGEAVAAFALYPMDIHDVFSISDEGGTLPPKSTWIEPKLRSGLVVHVVDEL